MKRKFFIVVCFIVFFLLLEISVYFIFVKEQICMVQSTNFHLPDAYTYSFKYDRVEKIINNNDNYRNVVSFGNKKNILIFGCSYAYGAQLQEIETFGYKLAKRLKSTVYNRSFPGFGLQHMYYQLFSSKLDEYVQTDDIDVIIYVYMQDHVNRLYAYFWGSQFENIFNIRYYLSDDKLKQARVRFPLINMLFLTKGIRNIAHNHYVKSYEFSEDSKQLMLALLEASYNKLKEKYPNARFIFLEYIDLSLSPFKDEIKNVGWEYFSTSDFIYPSIDLNEEEYHFKNDPHPTGKAWSVVVDSMVNEKVLY